MTTYEQKNESMDCPVCGKPLAISERQDKVACIDPKCMFNNGPVSLDVSPLAWYHTGSEEVLGYAKVEVLNDWLHVSCTPTSSFFSDSKKEIEDRNHFVEFRFEGSAEDVKKMIEEVKRIVKEIAPEAELVTEIIKN